MLQQFLEHVPVCINIIEPDDGRNLVARILARSPAMVQLFAFGLEVDKNVAVVELVCGRNCVNRNARHCGTEIVEHIVRYVGTPVTRNQERNALAHIPEQIQRLDVDVVAWLRHAFF